MTTVIDGTLGIIFPDATTQGSKGLIVGSASALTSGTAQNSTSGTSIDFTGIPSWVKRITVMLNGVSTNGTSLFQIQLGNGSVITTGYLSYASITGGGGTTSNSATTGFLCTAGSGSAATLIYGSVVLSLVGSNAWVASVGLGANIGGAFAMNGGGSIALGGALDRVRITTVNGTDTFDAGSINILYE